TGVALQDRLYRRLQAVSNDTVPDRGLSTPRGRVTTFRPVSGVSRALLIFEQSVSIHTHDVYRPTQVLEPADVTSGGAHQSLEPTRPGQLLHGHRLAAAGVRRLWRERPMTRGPGAVRLARLGPPT